MREMCNFNNLLKYRNMQFRNMHICIVYGRLFNKLLEILFLNVGNNAFLAFFFKSYHLHDSSSISIKIFNYMFLFINISQVLLLKRTEEAARQLESTKLQTIGG